VARAGEGVEEEEVRIVVDRDIQRAKRESLK
jgi:hypothetical protein